MTGTDIDFLCVASIYEPVGEKTNNLGSDQVQHKSPVQSQKKARSLKFRI